jgi:hypothetical protein
MTKLKNREYYDMACEKLTYDSDTGYLYRNGKRTGQIHNHGYEVVSISVNKKRKWILSHRVIWYMIYGSLVDCIDHIDRDKLNNKLSNLRDGTNGVNQRNIKIRSDNTSGVAGVQWHKAGQRWRSTISKNGKQRVLIDTDDFELACFARSEAEEVYYG